MRVLCLVDGVVKPPDRWLWSYLPALAQADTVDFLSFMPLGGYDVVELDGGAKLGGPPYAFAAGRSERDYRTLVDAFSGIAGRLVINARPFNLRGVSRPANVEFNDFMPRRDFMAAMVGAQFVIVPLLDTPHAAGIGHLIYAMAAGKAMVATRTVGTVDYVEDGVTGLLVPPGDVGAMRGSIQRLLNDPALASSMGRAARHRYEARYTM